MAKIKAPILLDSWLVFPKMQLCTDGSKQSWHFEIKDDQVLLSAHHKRRRVGELTFSLRWPAEAPDQSFGLLELMHPAWDTLPQRIVCTQVVSASPDDYDWRLMCPIRRTWNQVLFLDPDDMLFVSREMLGRNSSGRLVRRALRLYFKLLKFQEERGDLEEKPERLSEADYKILRLYSDLLWENFVLAARGVPDIDQIEKAFLKQYFRG